MAFDLNSIAIHTEVKPPINLFYGVPGVGKTSLLAKAPNSVFIRTEDGLGANRVPTFPQAENYDQVIEQINVLGETEHEYQWLNLDSLSALQELVFDKVCEEHNKGGIEDFGYGKGYVYAMDKWSELLSLLIALRDYKGMGINLIAHCQVTTFNNPEGDDYDKYGIDLDKRALKIFRERCDMIAFINYKTIIKKKDSKDTKGKGIEAGRIIYTKETPAFSAKNRFTLPPQIAIPEFPNDPWEPLGNAFANSVAGEEQAA